MKTNHVATVMLAAVLAGAAPANAQQVPAFALTKPIAVSDAEFERVSSVVELTPGVVLVADVEATRLAIVDFAAGISRTLGRRGAGPREYRAVERLIPRTGGGAWAVDFANRRLLPVLADASIGEAVLFPAGTAIFQSSDGSGRIYGDAMIFQDRVLSDSVRLVRWDPAGARVDTLAVVDVGQSGMVGNGKPFRVWRSSASWTALKDGRILLVESQPYRVSVVTGNRREVLATLPLERVPVSAADKDAWMKAQMEQPVRRLGSANASAPAQTRLFRNGVEYPEAFPAFEAGMPLLASADGNYWIGRLGSPGASSVRYDVVSATGRVVAHVTLPARSRVVALGRTSVYVVEPDADDFPRLRQYALPAIR